MNSRTRNIIIFSILLMLVGCTNSIKNKKESEYALIKGINLTQQGNYEDAIREYNISYAINPKNPMLLKEMAFIYYQFNNYEKAENYWIDALDISPNDDEIIRNLATLYYKTGRFDSVLSIIDKSYNPSSDYYLKLKGLIEYKKNNYRGTEKYFGSIKLENFDLESYLIYLDVIKNMKSSTEYYVYLKKGLDLFSNDKNYILYYAQEMAFLFKEYDIAEQILLAYLVDVGSDNQVIEELSSVYLKAGENEKSNDILLLLNKR